MKFLRNTQTYILLFVAIFVNVTGCLGWGLLVSFVLPFLICWKNKWLSQYYLLLVPLVMITLSQINRDILSVLMWMCILYGIRYSIQDTKWNGTKYWLFFAILSILIGFVNLSYCYFPIVAFSLFIPIPVYSEFNNQFKWHKWFFIVYAILVIGTLLFSAGIGVKREKKVAYLVHGTWAMPTPELSINNLSNASMYAYSEFVDLIDADVIYSIDSIKYYDEVWIVTPTHPFQDAEIEQIQNWVHEGGHLIAVSDHTDLYGHGRCINQIVRQFGYNVDYSVSMNQDNTDAFKDVFGRNILIKSANSASGKSAFPLVCSYLWKEPAYYLNRNFFGPVAKSGNDWFGMLMLAGTKFSGRGIITILCDSTILANFNIYQPNTPNFIQYIQHYHPFARLVLFLPFIYILLILILLMDKRKTWHLLLSTYSLLFIIEFFPSMELNWGKNEQIWTGNKKYVYEGCPYASISTAYALSPLSGCKPRWIDKVSPSESNVIWVDTCPPPSKKWIWIKIEDKHIPNVYADNTQCFHPLYQALDLPTIKQPIYKRNGNTIETNGVFNDRVMGSWWFNTGISQSKKYRFCMWLKQIPHCKECAIGVAPNFKRDAFSQDVVCGVLHIKKKDPICIKIPKPTASNGEVYLGNGLSAYIYSHDGITSLIGYSNLQEDSEAVDIWTLDYIEK